MKKTILVTGYYGTGKSEFSINLALKFKNEGNDVFLADLDIINPYFRSVEASQFLKSKEINVISTSLKGKTDLPTIPAEVFGLFNIKDAIKIIDLGGDQEGARILGYLKDVIKPMESEFWFCVNANRTEINNLKKLTQAIKRIEEVSSISVTGLVNTTHLLSETTCEDIKKGEALCLAVNLPLIYNVFQKDLNCQCEKPFPIELYLKKPWEV